VQSISSPYRVKVWLPEEKVELLPNKVTLTETEFGESSTTATGSLNTVNRTAGDSPTKNAELNPPPTSISAETMLGTVLKAILPLTRETKRRCPEDTLPNVKVQDDPEQVPALLTVDW
jgi:hypothetical protein